MKKENKKYSQWEPIIERWHCNKSDEKSIDEKSVEYRFSKHLNDLSGKVEILSRLTPTDTAWKRFKTQANAKKMWVVWSKYAAIIVVSLFVGSVFNWFYSGGKSQSYNTIEVPFGQTAKVTLVDGSCVWLNSGTKFRYPNNFSESNREVYLDGEAFCDIAKDSKHPFLLKTKRINVEVLGTSFNVSAYAADDAEEVVLVEGKVNLLSANGKLLSKMLPNDQVKIKGNSLKKNRVDATAYNAWRDGKLEFSSEKLGDVAMKLGRWYNVDIEFVDKSLECVEISGTFLRSKPFTQALEALSILANVKCELKINIEEKDKVIICKSN